MGVECEEIKSHYHLIYDKKTLHGIFKIEINLLAPRSEIGKITEEIHEMLLKIANGQRPEQ